MSAIVIPAHFDGERILLDEPVDLKPDARLLVTVLPEEDQEREEWYRMAEQALNRAYGSDEPEYTLDDIIKANPDYERR
jgi:hypothetical protein